MAKVECKFHGARPLISGALTGMVSFAAEVDEHKLIDLRRRGTVYLTDEACTVEAGRDATLKDCRDLLERIQALLCLEEAAEELKIGSGNYEGSDE